MKEKSKLQTRKLLDKGRRSLLRGIFSRTTVIAILLILQVLFLMSAFSWFQQYQSYFRAVEIILEIFAVLYLVNSEMDALSRITWLLLIMITPLLGVLFLIYTKLDWGYRGLKARLSDLTTLSQPYLPENTIVVNELKKEHSTTYNLVKYFRRTRDGFPVYTGTKVTYFPSGEAKFAELKKQLLQAKKYIFLEYFIIDEGLMWGEILAILEQKVNEGVEVRVMYDGMIEFSTLSFDYTKRLATLGIKAKAFSSISPFISTYYNYRDHRKIVVIDGEVAFTGGVNLADEYINHIERFGHWKDTAIMLEGKAVDVFTILFLQMWSITDQNPDFQAYLGQHQKPIETDGYIIPYGDSPLDTDKIGENVYIDILNHAHDYVHIMTPYLILNSELEHAIRFAAERGVEVIIIMPGIPDKPVPYALAKTYYEPLIKAGVKIYEYTPGFVHAKVFVSDQIKAVVGTINLDYRSLYHHFECATYLYKASAISHIERDFQETLAKSQQVTLESLKKESLSTKITGHLVKTIAPLL
ncbi:cardiolipin synthase [Streptococcus cuniculipharyngis]|uniref:Cardiolipin synthase n=1 Tax=Streptococcus cuniculipharyngis TaxID=1562651 RepID=A0A5C5SFD4_9STRE|nr:cardiolipin synthase [Streptococcus cuniculipharyngis]TWS98828.1 cardiolipin synthase [Streptococcus cuniculipharyngis]